MGQCERRAGASGAGRGSGVVGKPGVDGELQLCEFVGDRLLELALAAGARAGGAGDRDAQPVAWDPELVEELCELCASGA